jgi:propanediol dehydratase large subunit
MTKDIRPEPHHGANRWQRFADWDERPLRLDKFAVEDAENGFAAFRGARDPKPGLIVEHGSRRF